MKKMLVAVLAVSGAAIVYAQAETHVAQGDGQGMRAQMMQDDFMNNCATRTVLSGVLGAGLGVVFGIFMGTMSAQTQKEDT